VCDALRSTSPWGAPSARAIVLVFGAPIDYADLRAEKPRPTLYKKCADRFMAEVGKLAVRERALRADLAAGRISASDPRWLDNRPISRLYAHEGRA
jgi:hypothetical protein